MLKFYSRLLLSHAWLLCTGGANWRIQEKGGGNQAKRSTSGLLHDSEWLRSCQNKRVWMETGKFIVKGFVVANIHPIK